MGMFLFKIICSFVHLLTAASLDLEMPGPPRYRTQEGVQEALKSRKISVEDVDNRVLSTLKLLKKTGKFDDRKETPKEQAIDRPEHRALIRKAGGEGIVVLKNEKSILPINPKKTKKIALLGPLANYAAAHGGGSASLNCHYKVTPYEAFTTRLGSEVEITHSKGMLIHHYLRKHIDLVKAHTSSECILILRSDARTKKENLDFLPSSSWPKAQMVNHFVSKNILEEVSQRS